MKELTSEEIERLIEAVVGEPATIFARRPMEAGDTALVFRKAGGVEVLTLLGEEVDPVELTAVGMRAIVTTAVWHMLQMPSVVDSVLKPAVAEVHRAASAEEHAIILKRVTN